MGRRTRLYMAYGSNMNPVPDRRSSREGDIEKL